MQQFHSPPPPKKLRLLADNSLFETQLGKGNDADLEKYVEMVYKGEDVEYNAKFKMQKWRSTFVITDLPPNPENLLLLLFKKCIDDAIQQARQNNLEPDTLGLTIASRLLDYDIWIPIRSLNPNIAEAALNRFQLVAQSKTNEGNLMGEPFSIIITTVDKKQLAGSIRNNQLEGSGRQQKLVQVQYRISRNCLIPIYNKDAYCLFHALFLTYNHKLKLLSKQNFYKLVHRDHEKRQKQVIELMESADIPLGLSSYSARTYVSNIVNYWNELNKGRQLRFKIFVFEAQGDFKPAFSRGPSDFNVPIAIYYDEKHFWGVRSIAGLFEKNNYCLGCLSPYKDAKLHRKDCSRLCLNCGRMGYNCCFKNSVLDYERHCDGCYKKFLDK